MKMVFVWADGRAEQKEVNTVRAFLETHRLEERFVSVEDLAQGQVPEVELGYERVVFRLVLMSDGRRLYVEEGAEMPSRDRPVIRIGGFELWPGAPNYDLVRLASEHGHNDRALRLIKKSGYAVEL